jgi:hypothetical protein
MTAELPALYSDLASSFFRYAHISGALEVYMDVLLSRDLQKTYSRIMSGAEREWEQIHRFMVVDGINVKWYPELPVQNVVSQKRSLFDFVYGVTLSHMIGDLEIYFNAIMRNYFKETEVSGNSWTRFAQKTGIDLRASKHGAFVCSLLRDRELIEHGRARVDRVFLSQMSKQQISHVYGKGDAVQKNHIDVVLTYQAIREFAGEVDAAFSKMIGA